MQKPRYSAADIVVLTAVQAIRKRPRMYLGDLEDGAAATHALRLAVEHSLLLCGLQNAKFSHVVRVSVGWGTYRLDVTCASEKHKIPTEEKCVAACEHMSAGVGKIAGLLVLNGISDRFDLRSGAAHLAYREGVRIGTAAPARNNDTALSICGQFMSDLDEHLPSGDTLDQGLRGLETKCRRVVFASA